jgi:hypothetical protein
MHEDAAARREAWKLVLTHIAGEASANSQTSFFGVGIGVSILPALA